MRTGQLGSLVGMVALGIAAVVAAKPAPLPPGMEPFSPTRLEWAALELQANHGEMHEPIMAMFRPASDGFTVLCVLNYPPDTSTSALAMTRDTIKQVFEIYRDGREWPWMRLEFRDETPGK